LCIHFAMRSGCLFSASTASNEFDNLFSSVLTFNSYSPRVRPSFISFLFQIFYVQCNVVVVRLININVVIVPEAVRFAPTGNQSQF
ncbi:MAG: hypothetical protein ACK55Z_23570, partial [bacterium]